MRLAVCSDETVQLVHGGEQSLQMDCPEPRPVQPPDVGEVVEVHEAGGLYQHYERAAA
jgi:hypothetical protein